MQRPPAVVIGGLLTATMLTMLVLPTIYFSSRPRRQADEDQWSGVRYE
jgi:Cu/Ag efflux pump CusA